MYGPVFASDVNYLPLCFALTFARACVHTRFRCIVLHIFMPPYFSRWLQFPSPAWLYLWSLATFFPDITMKCTHLGLNSSSGSAYFGVAPTARICVSLSERLSFSVGWAGTEPSITINFVWLWTRMSWCVGFLLRGKPFLSPAPLSSPLDFHRRAVLDRVLPTAQLENFPSSCPRGSCQVERFRGLIFRLFGLRKVYISLSVRRG